MTATAVQATEPQLSDEELSQRLATLQDMHDKIFQLRALLPERLIHPVRAAMEASRRGEEPPGALGRHMELVARDGHRDVQAFKAMWHSEEMRGLWARTQVAAFPQGTDVWGVDYQAAVGKGRKEGMAASQDGRAKENVAVADADPDADVEEVVKKFKDEHSGIKLDVLVKEADGFAADVKVAGQALSIRRVSDETEYRVAEKAGSNMSTLKREMLRSLGQRSSRHSLAYLLDMIASYSDVQTRPCDKCQNIFDKDLQLASVRIVSPATDAVEHGTSRFKAYHQGCLQ